MPSAAPPSDYVGWLGCPSGCMTFVSFFGIASLLKKLPGVRVTLAASKAGFPKYELFLNSCIWRGPATATGGLWGSP